MSNKDYGKQLSDPFEEGDIEWRVQQSGVTKAGKGWVMVIPYITSRAIQQRLDDVFGVFGWENKFKATEDKKGYLCGISVKSHDAWITKWDGAEFTGIEPLKGALSGATKRAGVQLGIGRYLYNLETEFATCRPVNSRFECSDNGTFIEIKLDKRNKNSAKVSYEWFPPSLPEWALPSVKYDDLIDRINAATDLIVLRGAYQKAYKYANSFNRGDLLKKIIETKDKRKKHLEGNSKAEMQEEEKKLRVWLELAVTDGIFGAKNESVLKLAKKRISEELKSRSIDSEVDIMEMMKVLEDYYQKKLSKLNRA